MIYLWSYGRRFRNTLYFRHVNFYLFFLVCSLINFPCSNSLRNIPKYTIIITSSLIKKKLFVNLSKIARTYSKNFSNLSAIYSSNTADADYEQISLSTVSDSKNELFFKYLPSNSNPKSLINLCVLRRSFYAWLTRFLWERTRSREFWIRMLQSTASGDRVISVVWVRVSLSADSRESKTVREVTT